MSKLLTISGAHKIEWMGIDEDQLWNYDLLLLPSIAKRQMGRDPIVIVGRRYLRLKKIQPLERDGEALLKWFRIGCELIHTEQ